MSIKKLDANLDGIGHVLSELRIEVPHYQRSYSWGDEQIEDLFRDLADAIRAKRSEYFLGTIVLTEGEDAGAKEVIDGQQRLATVSIFLSAVRNYFQDSGDTKGAAEIHREYVGRTDLRTRAEAAYLKLNAVDNIFYEKNVLNVAPKVAGLASKGKKTPLAPPIPASHKKLQQAIDLCRKQVAQLATSTQEPIELLLDWVDYLKTKARVIVITVSDESSAYTIFEVLNDRGAELTIADLLKNYVFRKAKQRLPEAQEHWSKMVATFEAAGAEEKDLRSFIRLAWASKYGLTRERELFTRMRATISAAGDAVDFSFELSEHARNYVALENPGDEIWKEFGSQTREAVDALKLLKASQMRSLLLSVLRCFDKEQVKKTLPMLVCWMVRFNVTGKLGGGPLETGYADRAKEVRAGSITTAKQLYEASKTFLATDAEFEESFLKARVTAQYLARFYLRVLNKQNQASTSEMIVNPSEEQVNLEHIMPQTLAPHWNQIVSPEVHAAYFKRIGNLALLDKKLNEQAGNLPFGSKLAAYKKSNISLTSELASLTAWDISAIELRQKKLTALALKAWPLAPR